MPEKKEYVLVSSDAREPSSASTTDFTVKMQVPLTNVIRTDLVQVAMDYRIANVVDLTFTLGDGLDPSGNPLASTYVIDDGLYTPYSLCEEIKYVLGADYEVSLTALGSIVIQDMVNTSTIGRDLSVESISAQTTFGMSEPTLSPVLYNGVLTWRFPRSVSLTDNEPYMFIKSRFLGTVIRTAQNTQGFWRMVLNDVANGYIYMTNNRVDQYTEPPRTIQDIDIQLVYEDGTVVNNRGGQFALLLEVVRQIP